MKVNKFLPRNDDGLLLVSQRSFSADLQQDCTAMNEIITPLLTRSLIFLSGISQPRHPRRLLTSDTTIVHKQHTRRRLLELWESAQAFDPSNVYWHSAGVRMNPRQLRDTAVPVQHIHNSNCVTLCSLCVNNFKLLAIYS